MFIEKISQKLLDNKRFLGAAGWSLVSSFIAQLLVLITMASAARLLDNEQYGQLVFLQNTVLAFGVFAGLGIGTAVIHYASMLKSIDLTRLSRILGALILACICLSLCLLLIILFKAEFLADRVMNSRELKHYLPIVGAALVFIVIDNFNKSLLLGLGSMRAYVASIVIGAILGSLAFLIGGIKFGLDGFVYGILVNYILQFLVSSIIAKRACIENNVHIDLKHSKLEWRTLRDFALPGMLGGAVIQPAHWFCQALLAHKPGGYTDIAIFGIAFQWFSLVQFIPLAAGKVLLPLLSEYVHNKGNDKARNLIVFSVFVNGIVSIPSAILISILSQFILGFYGADYQQYSNVLIFASLASVLLAIQMPVGNLVASTSRMWTGFFMNIGWAAVYTFSATELLAKGALGIIQAMIIAYVVHATWTFYYAYRHFGSKTH